MAIGRGGGDIGRIRIRLGVDGADLDRDIDSEVNRAAGRSEGTFGKWGKRAAGAFAAVFAADVGRRAFDATVGSFAGFETRMNEVFTLLPGISDQAMRDMTGQVKSFAKEFGVLPDKVVPALYQSLSAGVPPDNVFAFLEQSQKAAKGGVTDLTTAVDGISSVVNAYGSDVLSAAQASDLMFTAVRMGKTTFGELSQSLFNVTPTAAALGVTFGDVTASLASLTAQGVPTSVATTQLRQLFVELSKEGSSAAGVFEKLAGKTFKEFVAGGGNVQQALQLMERHAQTTGVGVNDLFGSVEAGSAALALTGKGTETLTRNLEAMGSSAGATDAAFDRMNKGIGPVFDRMRARASVALLDVGQKVVQFGSQVVEAFQSFRRFGEWDASGPFEKLGVAAAKAFDALQPVFSFIRDNARPILIGLGVAVATVVVPALASMAVSALAAVAPLVLIAAAVAGGIIVFQRFAVVREVLGAVADFITGKVVPAVVGFAKIVAEQWSNLVAWTQETWGQVSEAVGHVVNVVQAVIGGFVAFVQHVWRQWGDEVLNIARIVWDQVRNIVETVLGVIRGVIETVLAVINGDWGRAWDGIKSILSTAWEYIRETVVNALRLLREAVEAGIGAVLEFFVGVPRRILDALGDVASLLWDAGVNLMKGMLNGIKSMAGKLASAAWDTVKGAVKSAWDAIVPGSPSKIGTAIGMNFGEGIAQGLTRSGSIVDAAVPPLMEHVIRPFRVDLGQITPPTMPLDAIASAHVPSSAGGNDPDRIGDAVARAFARAGIAVQVDRQVLGRVTDGALEAERRSRL